MIATFRLLKGGALPKDGESFTEAIIGMLPTNIRVQEIVRQTIASEIAIRGQVIQDNDAAYKALYKITKAPWFEDVCISKTLYNELGFARLAALI